MNLSKVTFIRKVCIVCLRKQRTYCLSSIDETESVFNEGSNNSTCEIYTILLGPKT